MHLHRKSNNHWERLLVGNNSVTVQDFTSTEPTNLVGQKGKKMKCIYNYKIIASEKVSSLEVIKTFD